MICVTAIYGDDGLFARDTDAACNVAHGECICARRDLLNSNVATPGCGQPVYVK